LESKGPIPERIQVHAYFGMKADVGVIGRGKAVTEAKQKGEWVKGVMKEARQLQREVEPKPRPLLPLIGWWERRKARAGSSVEV
jgi:hypothetical protein